MPATLDIAAITGGLQTLSILSGVFLGVITIVLGLRIWTRAVLLGAFHTDDYFALLSYVCLLGNTITTIIQNEAVDGLFHGRGLDFVKLIGMTKSGVCTYILSMAALKVSLGTFFLRIFTVQKWQRYTIFAIMAVTVLFAIAFLVLACATCGPELNFVPGVKQCAGANAYAKVALTWSYINAITSFILSALAVNAMWKANMRALLKVSTSIVLIIGTLGGMASIVRIVIISSDNGGDPQMQGIRYGWWTAIEAGVGLLAACLACLRPLFKHVIDRTKALRGASSGVNKSGKTTVNERLKTHRGGQSRVAPLSVKEWTVETSHVDGSYSLMGPVNTVKIEACASRKESA